MPAIPLITQPNTLGIIQKDIPTPPPNTPVGENTSDSAKNAFLKKQQFTPVIEVVTPKGIVLVVKNMKNRYFAITPIKFSNQTLFNYYPLPKVTDPDAAQKFVQNSGFNSYFPLKNFSFTTMREQLDINYKILIENLGGNNEIIKDLAANIIGDKTTSLSEKQFRINMLIAQYVDLSKFNSIFFGNSILNQAIKYSTDARALNLTIQGTTSVTTSMLLAEVTKRVKDDPVTKIFISVGNVNDAKLEKFNSNKTTSTEAGMLLKAARYFSPENIILVSETGRKPSLDRKTQTVFTNLSKSPILKTYWPKFKQIQIAGHINLVDKIHLDIVGKNILANQIQLQLASSHDAAQ